MMMYSDYMLNTQVRFRNLKDGAKQPLTLLALHKQMCHYFKDKIKKIKLKISGTVQANVTLF